MIFAAPFLVHVPAVRAELERRLSEAVGGKFTWQALNVDWLPTPRAEFERVRIDVPGKLAFAADELHLVLHGQPLLRGEAQLSFITLRRGTVRVAAAPAGARDAQLDAAKLYREALAPLVPTLRRLAPDTHIAVSAATLDFEAAGFQLRDVNLYARTAAQSVAFEGAATSALWKRAGMAGRIQYDDLAAHARVEMDGIALDADVPRSTLSGEVTTDARNQVEGTFEARLDRIGTAKGRVVLPSGRAPLVSVQVNARDSRRAIGVAQRKLPKAAFVQSAGGRVSAKTAFVVASRPKDPWRLELEITPSAEDRSAEPPEPAATEAAAVKPAVALPASAAPTEQSTTPR